MSPPKTKSRHGVRARGKTHTSVSLRADLLALARTEAAREGRSFSNWLERLLLEQLADLPEDSGATGAKARKKAPRAAD